MTSSIRWIATGVAVLCAVAFALSACSGGKTATAQTSPSAPTASATSATSSASSSVPTTAASTVTSTPPKTTPPKTTAPKPAPTSPVHVRLLEDDGGVYGVGMPIIAWFSVAPTDAHAFAKATSVTVNGSPIEGAWYFEPSTHADQALEAHWRPKTYWPAHAKIFMKLPVQGLSAGKGLAYDDSLTLSISTGASHISTVDSKTLRMTVTSDGKRYGVFPVSLGASDTPTARGTKVIMEKGRDISMRGPDYYDPHVEWTQRLTYGGEYLHSAPWNVGNIGSRSTSNGCTNMLPADAKRLYNFLSIGDVVLYPNANGPQMALGAGYGDWNVSWSQWLTGGDLKTS